MILRAFERVFTEISLAKEILTGFERVFGDFPLIVSR